MEYLMTGNEEKTTEEENLDQTDSINSDPPESGNSDESDNEDSVNVIMLSAEEYEQLKNAKAESDEKQKQMLYKMAEYDNLKKRADREKKDFLKYANESLVKDLVPVLDSIDQAVGAAQEAEIETAEGFTALREGVELIQKQLLGSLEKRGVSVIGIESSKLAVKAAKFSAKVNKIKRREKFRPFAPAILEEFADDYFNGPMNEYMQFVAKAKHDYNSVTHVDGTARVQLVKKNCSSVIRQVLELWYEETSVPMLLNTSLNIKGMPMVNNERDVEIFMNKYNVKVF